jgi:hypothetical protein
MASLSAYRLTPHYSDIFESYIIHTDASRLKSASLEPP